MFLQQHSLPHPARRGGELFSNQQETGFVFAPTPLAGWSECLEERWPIDNAPPRERDGGEKRQKWPFLDTKPCSNPASEVSAGKHQRMLPVYAR
jgi:hypothetical protein